MEKTFLVTPSNSAEALPFAVIVAGITYPDPTYKISRENSPLYVIEYVEDGEGTVFVDGVRYDMKKGDAYILPKAHRHFYYSAPHNPWKKLWMNVTGDICAPLLNAYGIFGICRFPESGIGDIFNDFLSFCAGKSDISAINEMGAVCFLKIVQRLALKGNEENSLANEAKSYIDNNICKRITAGQTARRVSLSVSQLGRLFKAEYGQTVYAYILSVKLETAKNLLCNTSLPLCEISDMLGFIDEHYFSNIFKKKFGITPGKYRKSK